MEFKKGYSTLPKEEKARVVRQYICEINLSNKLRNANDTERLGLYSKVYDDFFKSQPDHPMVKRTKNKVYSRDRSKRHASLIRRFSKSTDIILEIGCGDCGTSIELSKYCKKVIGVDVTRELKESKLPYNFNFQLSDGVSINTKESSVNIVYSNMLIEHLHPKDAKTQTKNAYKVLKKGGMYICSTVHKYFGPADVSLYFENTPKGFHLKEYSNFELYKLFKKCGFSKMWLYTGIRRHPIKLPIYFSIFIEFILGSFPYEIRKKLSQQTIFRKFINGQFIAIK